MISGMVWRVSKPSSHPFNKCIIFLFPTRAGDDRGDVCVPASFIRGGRGERGERGPMVESVPMRDGRMHLSTCMNTKIKFGETFFGGELNLAKWV